MGRAANIVMAIIAMSHLYILVIEMFLWDTPKARKAFGLTPEFSAITTVMASDYGSYYGILATRTHGKTSSAFKLLFIQTVSASIALILILR